MIKFQGLWEKLPKAQLIINQKENQENESKVSSHKRAKIAEKFAALEREINFKMRLRKIEYKVKQKELEMELHRLEEEEDALKLQHKKEAVDARSLVLMMVQRLL